MDKTIGIYCFRNVNNGKVYVGSSKDLSQRQWTHLKNLKLNRHPNKHLQNAYNIDSFIYGVLEYCFQSDLLNRENYWIDRLKARNSEFGYNKMPAISGVQMTEEIRKKITASVKDRTKDGLSMSEWIRQWHADRKSKGLKNTISEEGRERMLEAIERRWADPKSKEVAKEKLKDRWQNPEYAAKHIEELRTRNSSEEMKEKNRQGQYRRWSDPEKLKTVSEQTKKRHLDPTYKAKLAAIYTDPEYKRQRSEKLKALWADPEYRNRMLASRLAKRKQKSI